MSVTSTTRRRNSRRRVEVTPRDARPRVAPCVSMHQAIDALAVAMDQVVALAAVGADGVTNATGLGAGEVAVALAAERRRLEAALAEIAYAVRLFAHNFGKKFVEILAIVSRMI